MKKHIARFLRLIATKLDGQVGVCDHLHIHGLKEIQPVTMVNCICYINGGDGPCSPEAFRDAMRGGK